MSSVNIFLQNASGWLRLFLIITLLWLIVSITYIAQSFPTEESMRAEYNHTTAIWLDAFANPQSIADNCMKLDDIRQVMACYEVMGYKRAVEYRKEEGERRRQEADSTIEANLLPAQLKASAVGLAICVVPVVLVFLLGLAVKWVARGFQKKN